MVVLFILTACEVPQAGQATVPSSSTNQQVLPGGQDPSTPFQTTQIEPVNVYFSQGVPEEWVNLTKEIQGVTIIRESVAADITLGQQQAAPGFTSVFTNEVVFAAAVPFYTVRDNVDLDALMGLWSDESNQEDYSCLLVSAFTENILSGSWGQPGESLIVLPEEEIVPRLENDSTCLAIVPFEDITPRMKILKLEGLSPLDKPLDKTGYPLIAHFTMALRDDVSEPARVAAITLVQKLPVTNRDEYRMTVIVMSGTTALVRATAAKIRDKGQDYPIDLVKDWFLKADIRHVSNEVSFMAGCPDPDPYSSSLQFCSDPANIGVLERLGVNVVELTGNHVNDYGPKSLAATIKMYQARDWVFYGGGENSQAATQPGLLINNGNKIAFVGCNRVGPTQAWADETHAGAAQCDFDALYRQISELKSQGYVVITTYQHQETYQYMYEESSEKSYARDFQRAIAAGADIVQGSQAHYPMGFELIGSGFIHYGLGNFLFDQMDIPVKGTRREFIDRHIVYDGSYINTEILTAWLQDYSRPTPMDTEDRAQFLSDLFQVSKR